MPLKLSRRDLFPDDTNPLPEAGSAEQSALLEDELEIGTEDYFKRLQQFSNITDNIYPELIAATKGVVAEALGDKPLRVLDLCSGIGIVSFKLLEEKLPIDSLTLADLSPELLQRALAYLRKHHGPEPVRKVDTVQLDLLVNDLRQRSHPPYDLVITCNAFQHFPRERQCELFKQVYDILDPSGVFIFESHFKLLCPEWKKQIVDEHQAQMRAHGAPAEMIAKARDHFYNFHNYLNLVDVYNWLETAGFGFYDCVFRQHVIGIFAAVK